MRNVLFVTFAAFSLMSRLASCAETTEELAKSKLCLNCHSVNTKIVGPAYKDVAAKYAKQKDAENKLVQKVLQGGSGVWGTVVMPPNTQVTEEQAHILVRWILSQK